MKARSLVECGQDGVQAGYRLAWNASDTNYSTVEKTGGASTQALSVAEMPSHNHSFSGSVTVNANGAHTHSGIVWII